MTADEERAAIVANMRARASTIRSCIKMNLPNFPPISKGFEADILDFQADEIERLAHHERNGHEIP